MSTSPSTSISSPDRHEDDADDDQRLNSANCRHVDVEKIWNHLGKFGKFQLFQSFLLIVGGIGLAPPVVSSIFTGKDVKFKCADDSTTSSNSSAFVSFCEDLTFTGNTSAQGHSDGSCHEYVYESGDRHSSFISEWDLVCDREALATLAQVLVMVGMGVGAFCLPPIGDRFGRKKLMIFSELMVITSSVALSLSPSYELFAVLKVVNGAGEMGQCVSAATLHLELYPTEQRSAVSFILVVRWCLSYALMVGIAWLMQDYAWTTISLALACCSAGTFLQLFFQEESLRWLLTKGHIHKARVLLVKACRWNGKDYDQLMRSVTDDQPARVNQDNGIKSKEDEIQPFLEHPRAELSKEDSSKKTVSFLDLFATPGLRRMTLIMAYTWCINSLTYYGLTLMSSSLFGDPYLNNLVAAILELLSGVLMFYTIFKYGRKHTLIVFILLAGVFLMGTVLVDSFAPASDGFFILQTVFAQLGKCFISGSFNTLWCYTQELYPTYMRNMGVGFSSTAARVGSSVSPLFRLLAKQAPWAPGTIFSVCCFLCSFMLVAMPETRYRQLPTSIAEVEAWFSEEEKNKKDKSRDMKDNSRERKDNCRDRKDNSRERKDNSMDRKGNSRNKNVVKANDVYDLGSGLEAVKSDSVV